MKLECGKCGAEIEAPANRVDIGEDRDFGRIAYIGAGDVWSGRHDGEPMLCPFHPGMRYFLYPKT